jgi:uncharacterized protein with HEPN domain
MKGKMGDRQRLVHIIDSISEIERYILSATFEDFAENSMMRFATIKQIEIIGEAANYLTDEIKDGSADIAWRQIIGLRHILVHEYFGIDTLLIWQIISADLPKLKADVLDILSTFDLDV